MRLSLSGAQLASQIALRPSALKDGQCIRDGGNTCCVCVCVCARARARLCVRLCVRACVHSACMLKDDKCMRDGSCFVGKITAHTYTQTFSLYLPAPVPPSHTHTHTHCVRVSLSLSLSLYPPLSHSLIEHTHTSAEAQTTSRGCCWAKTIGIYELCWPISESWKNMYCAVHRCTNAANGGATITPLHTPACVCGVMRTIISLHTPDCV